MDADLLNVLASEAIRRAEFLQETRSPDAPDAWRALSRLEEHLVSLHEVSSVEGAVARRGAVHAALMANDLSRASNLADRFRQEPGADESVTRPIAKMIEEAGRAFDLRFPFATAKYGRQAILEAARRVAEHGAAFGMAA